jgi:Fe2+ transport system protein B
VLGHSKLDKILLKNNVALPIFFGNLIFNFLLNVLFVLRFLSSILRDFIQGTLGGNIVLWLRGVCDIAWVVDLVETGILGGVGSILAFLPQVYFCFFSFP